MRAPRSGNRLTRRTPCIGICSTTYGDLVCRGCKRFSHEIVGWNTYTEAQRQDIESRLARLKAGVVAGLVTVLDETQCRQAIAADAQAHGQEPDDKVLELQIYDYLTRARPDSELQQLAPLAIRMPSHIESITGLREAVEAEFLSRSKAAYERSFKVSVD
ncbi:MAG: DUF1289 domain-containing protein [Pseudomonadales bacterium]